MLYTKHILHSIEETVSRPSLIAVVNDIKKFLGIHPETYVNYDPTTSMKKKIVNQSKIGLDNNYSEDLIYVETEENSLSDNELSMIPVSPDFIPIYKDDEINSKFTPIYHHRTVDINFTFKTKSKSKIYAIVNKLRLLTSSDGMYSRHDIEYHYVLPLHILNLLDEINNLKEKRNVDKLSLDKYIDNTFDNRVDYSTTHDGKEYKTEVVIREAQTDIHGFIKDSLHELKPEYDESSTYWTIDFTYEFSYEKPVVLLLQYPLMVFNTLIAKPFRTFTKTNTFKESNRSHRMSSMATVIENTIAKYPNYYRTIPPIDLEELPDTSHSLAKVISIIVNINEDDPNELFNLDEIPGLVFKDSVKKFILESEYPYIGKMNESMFMLELYKNNKLDYDNEIILSKDGVLTTKNPMSYKYIYRVVLSVLLDLDYLKPESKKRVKRFIDNEVKFDITSLDSDENIEMATNYANDNLINNYIELLSIPKKDIEASINVSKTHSDVIFNIKESNLYKYKNTELLITIPGIFKERS